MKSVYYNAGLRIRDLREKKHYTREKLAEMAEISSKFLYEIEIGTKGFSADTLYKLSEALDTNADYILYGEYRGVVDNEMLRVLSRFEKSQAEDLIEIIDLIYKLSEHNR